MWRKQVIGDMEGIKREHAAAAHAVAALRARLAADPSLAPRLPAAADLRRCARGLEATYLVRLFAIFEEACREVWRDAFGKGTHPRAVDLLNGCASRQRIGDDDLRHAHGVREYRNTLVHGGDSPAMTLETACGRLCIFFRHMPVRW